MTVELLRLSGLDAAEAEATAGQLIDVRTGPRDLSNLLVIDDVALLAEHAPVYVSLDTANRVRDLLLVAIGPRAGTGRKLALPGSLAGTQGWPVIWVSDPDGIDCRVAVAALAIGHQPGRVSGLDLLVQILSAEEVFKQVHKSFVEEVPRRVANPGMRLAGQDDEAATFAAALILAIRSLCGPGPGAEGPFRELLPSDASGASLAEDGRLYGYRHEVASAVDGIGKRTRRGGRRRSGPDDLLSRRIEAGAALADLRDLVSQLLRNANSAGELTDNQRLQLHEAGIRFPGGPQPPAPGRNAGSAAEQPPVYRTVVKAVQGGDTLTLVSRRLTLTERELKHRGSASYLTEVEERCPQELIDRLASPAERTGRRGSAETRSEQDLGEAARAASELESLILTVASREWSPAGTSRTEVSRIRATLDGTSKALTEYADQAGTASSARAARQARLAELLVPVLRDLVFHVVAAEVAQPSATGLEAFGAARDRASGLIGDWAKGVQANGIASQPPFKSPSVPSAALYASADDVAEIREALLCQPAGEMWQLCGPDDLKSVLNLAVAPAVVRFAGGLNKDALAATLPGEQPVWTSRGSHAGLLRLVSLRPEYVASGLDRSPPAANSKIGVEPS
jgi:hypothetical protein